MHALVRAAAFAGAMVLGCSSAFAQMVLYSQTLGTTPPAVVNTDPTFPFTNCKAAEGCFATAGNGDVTNMPAAFTFTFALSPTDIANINNTAGVGVLTVVAARDIGHKTGDVATDWLVTTLDGNALGNLFQNTIDSCPAGERGTAYPQNTVCGPNFHTDVMASESVTIGPPPDSIRNRGLSIAMPIR